LMLKITVADTLAQFVDYGFSNIATLGTNLAWVTIYAFAIQILCDFWGYSTIALGSAYMLGMRLPINFNSPYSSTSLTEFWRRWHITLSSWLRDYLYIPLGGNRNNKTQRNLIVTMTLAGLWHGASWNFVLWGLLNGLWLSAERLLRIGKDKISSEGFFLGLAKKLLVFHGVCLLWVFFRAANLTDAMLYLKRLLMPPYDFSSSVPSTLSVIIILFVLFQKRVGQYIVDERFLTLTLTRQLAMTAVITLLLLAYSQARLDFIYFIF
ncbi:MAG TPA: MBOAT family O-acyltransferase, partial [Gallionella sp.]|nr:MBOAT family O-acyltransferase [Gallionella sp.]